MKLISALLAYMAISANGLDLLTPDGHLKQTNTPNRCVAVGKSFKKAGSKKVGLLVRNCNIAAQQTMRWTFFVKDKDVDMIMWLKLTAKPELCIGMGAKGSAILEACGPGNALDWDPHQNQLHFVPNRMMCLTLSKKKPKWTMCKYPFGHVPKCQRQHDFMRTYFKQGGRYLDYEMVTNDVWPHTYNNGTTYDGTMGYMLNVKSLKYLTEDAVTAHEWQHRVVVMIPPTYRGCSQTSAFMHVHGHYHDNRDAEGNLKDDDDLYDSPEGLLPDAKYMEEVAKSSADLGVVGIYMTDVLNQPMQFTGDAGFIEETDIDALSWMLFFQDPKRVVSTIATVNGAKAICKVFNAVQDFVEKNHNFVIGNYVITGESKRGWYATIAAFMDKRVTGLAPVVFDIYKMKKLAHDQYQSLGGWSYPMYEMLVRGVIAYLDPLFDAMYCYVDPASFVWEFADRKLPIFTTTASGDEFFLLQNNLVSYDWLRAKGVNWNINTLANTNHFLMYYTNDDMNKNHFSSIRKFSHYSLKKLPHRLPSISYENVWNNDMGYACILVTPHIEGTDVIAVQVYAWMADTNTADEIDPNGSYMDFRFTRLDGSAPVYNNVAWSPSMLDPRLTVTEEDGGVHKVKFDYRDGPGYRAAFAVIVFIYGDDGNGDPLEPFMVQSTPPLIHPAEFNVPDCDGTTAGSCNAGLRQLTAP